MINKIVKFIQWLFVKLLIVKQCGKYPDGSYITCGLNRKNPISIILAFVFCAVFSLIDYYEAFVDNWEAIMEDKEDKKVNSK